MIDILVIIIMLLAFYFGYRRGFIVSLVRLILLYLATLFAPSVAEPLGAIFLDNKYLAFVAGFFIVIILAMLVLKLLSPLIDKLADLSPFKTLDKILGGVLKFGLVLMIVSGLFAAFDYANIGNPNIIKATTYIAESGSVGDITDKVTTILEGDVQSCRQICDARFVDYETLDKSFFFNPLAEMGRTITPTLEELEESVTREAREGVLSSIIPGI